MLTAKNLCVLQGPRKNKEEQKTGTFLENQPNRALLFISYLLIVNNDKMQYLFFIFQSWHPTFYKNFYLIFLDYFDVKNNFKK
jgi:hypothetical protein